MKNITRSTLRIVYDFATDTQGNTVEVSREWLDFPRFPGQADPTADETRQRHAREQHDAEAFNAMAGGVVPLPAAFARQTVRAGQRGYTSLLRIPGAEPRHHPAPSRPAVAWKYQEPAFGDFVPAQ